jgi:type VI secretion system protein VasI
MRLGILMASMLMLSGGASFAQDPQECSKIEDSLQRLTCFDKLFPKSKGQAAATTSAAEVQPYSEHRWEIAEESSPVDDSKVVKAALMPVGSSSTGFNSASAYLLISCREQTTSFIISTEMFMTDEEPTVTTRVGNEPAVTGKWSRSTNYKAVGLWSGKQAIPFIKALKDNEKFFVRLQDKDRVDAEFNLANVSEVIGKISTACRW